MKSNVFQNPVLKYVNNVYCKHPEEYLNYRLGDGTHAEDAFIPVMKEAFFEVAKDKPVVLDLGCGFSSTFKDLPISYYIGVDISEELIKRHPLYGKPNAEFHKKDVRYCKFDKLTYNFVNGTLILNYLKHPSKLLKKVKRKGVSFCFVMPNPHFDQKFGELNGYGTITLVLNQYKFVYYFQTIGKIKSWFENPDVLRVAYTAEIAEGIPPVYVCFYGRW